MKTTKEWLELKKPRKERTEDVLDRILIELDNKRIELTKLFEESQSGTPIQNLIKGYQVFAFQDPFFIVFNEWKKLKEDK